MTLAKIRAQDYRNSNCILHTSKGFSQSRPPQSRPPQSRYPVALHSSVYIITFNRYCQNRRGSIGSASDFWARGSGLRPCWGKKKRIFLNFKIVCVKWFLVCFKRCNSEKFFLFSFGGNDELPTKFSKIPFLQSSHKYLSYKLLINTFPTFITFITY